MWRRCGAGASKCGMNLDAFWSLIAESRERAEHPDARIAWLTERLAGLPAEDIVDFQVHLDRLRKRVDTWDMWAAGYLICDGLCSDDGFWYLQAWLVGLGREAFERVAVQPDALVDLPEVRRLAGRGIGDWAEEEWPELEALDYVAE